jgi:hypothetical protein
MTKAGMSTRPISSALGCDHKTEMGDRQVVQNGPPGDEPIDAEGATTTWPRQDRI